MVRIITASNLILVLSLLLISTSGCSHNKQKNLIESYVCTTDGVLSDLNFKAIKLAETKPIKVFDSLVFFVYGSMP